MSFDRVTSCANYRVVVMGTAGVGKSSIIKQFMHNKFTETYKETIEELHRHRMKFDALSVEMDILDTSGTNEFLAMRKLAIARGDAFILVYALNDRESFEVVRSLREEIKGTNQKEHYSIIVANKADLRQEPLTLAVNESVVCMDWGEKFVSTSAKTGENIDIVFQMIELKIKERLQLEEKRHSFFRRISMPIMKLSKSERSVAPRLRKNTSSYFFGGNT